MADSKNIIGQITKAGNGAIDTINRLDDATAKFQKGQRRGSIVKSAQGNVFEFPVFISNSVDVDYATATTSLLEQVYASYLQMAISINPVVDANTVKNGLQFANFKTNTNKYLEYTDMAYAHDACHAIYQEGDVQIEFSLLSIEDHDARLINEAVDHQPLSEFDHFFQEAEVNVNRLTDQLFPMPRINPAGDDAVRHPVLDRNGEEINNLFYYEIDPTRQWGTLDEIRDYLTTTHGFRPDDAEDILASAPYTMRQYGLNNISAYDVDQATNASDREQMIAVRNACSVITTGELLRNRDLQNRINDLNTRYPGFRAEMEALTNNVVRANDLARREDEIHRIRYGTHDSGISAAQDVDNTRMINARNAARANSRYYRAADAINTGVQTAGNIAGTVNAATDAIYNVTTLKDRIRNEKMKGEHLRKQIDNMDEELHLKKQDITTKVGTAAKAPTFIDESKCQKLNTMKPLLMNVTINMLNKDDTIQPINYIVGVKTHSRVVQASILPEVARYPLKEMDKISRKIKWRAGELKFLKDLVFRIKEKKQTAADARDPRRKWYRRLYELAHIQGDAPAAAVVQGKSIFASFIRDKQGKSKLQHGVIPNATIIMSQADVDNIKNQTDIDLLKGSVAKEFCGELFLMCLVIIDMDARSIKMMLPDYHNDYEVHSIASVEKQLATLDTTGSRTRDMFKLLGS